MENNKNKIKAFLGRYIKIQDLDDDKNIFDLGLVNSLFSMQLVMFLEKEFNIKVENNDLNIDNFSTVNKLTDFIERKSV